MIYIYIYIYVHISIYHICIWSNYRHADLYTGYMYKAIATMITSATVLSSKFETVPEM